MHTASDMPKELIFKLRLDEKDNERLDALVAHHEQPKAGVVRKLIKQEYERLQAETPAVLSETALEKEHEDILLALRDGSEQTRSELTYWLSSWGWDAKWRGLNRALNDLRRGGFITKRGDHYKSTPKGLTAREWPETAPVSESKPR